TLLMQERLKGTLKKEEVVDVAFREKPFSVRMDWRKGWGKARRLLYVQGENGGKVLVRPSGPVAWRLGVVVARDPRDADVTGASRYPPTEFGIKIGMQRALAAWEAAKKRGDLKVTFLGEKRVKELGGRACWVVKRSGYKKPEDDGITGTVF